MRLPLLVTDPNQVRDNHRTYWHVMSEAKAPTSLIDVIPYIQSWLAFGSSGEGWEFSPSKFVGYHRITIAQYDEHHKALDGRQTERVMAPWLKALDPSEATDAREALFDFCQQFGKRPNGRFRISRLTDATTKAQTPNDRDATIAKLIVELARTLPRDRQLEVSRSLR